MSLVAFMAAREGERVLEAGRADVILVPMPPAIASGALIAGNVDFATVGGSALTASLGRAAAAALQLVQSIAVLALFEAGDH